MVLKINPGPTESPRQWIVRDSLNGMWSSTYIIPHLHNLFLFQCDDTRSLNRNESPGQTVYWPTAYNFVSTVSMYWPIQVLCCVKIGGLLQYTAYDI